MTSTVRSTIIDALPGAAASSQYVEYVDAVDQALTERDHNLTDAITGQVVQHFGVTEDQVRVALEDLGMAVRPAPATVLPEPTAEDRLLADLAELPEDEEAPAKGKKGKKPSKKERFNNLEAAVAKLIAIAERHGL